MNKKKRVSRTFIFTEKRLEKLPPNDKNSKSTDQEWSDKQVPGLKFFCSKVPGKKSYHLRYTFNGRKRIIKVCDFKSLSLKEARRIALKYKGMVDQGIDPLELRHKASGVPTLKEFSKTYLEWCRVHKAPSSYRSDNLLLRNSIIPGLGSIRLSQLSKKDVESYLLNLKKRVANSTVNRHRALISKLLSYALELSVIEGENVCRKVQKLRENPPPPEFLDKSGMKRLLAVLNDYPNDRSALLIKLLLFTGLRRGEVLKIEIEHVKTPGQIYIPGENSKGRRSRVVQINAPAQEVIGELLRLRVKGNPYLFPSPIKRKTHLANPSKFWRKIRQQAGMPTVKLHSLRHSYASAAIEAGCSLYSVKEMLGHANQKTTEIYSHLTKNRIREDVESVGRAIASAANT